MIEEWKDVVGFEEYFQVSDLGRVFGKRSGRVLKLEMSQSGYQVFSTRIGGRSGKVYTLRVHRLVAEAFLPPPSEEVVEICSRTVYGKVVVRHLDDNKLNNCASNLAWGTHKDNSADYFATERSKFLVPSGSDHVRSKLSSEDISFIRENYIPRHKLYGSRALARKFDVGHQTILSVVKGQTYKSECSAAS